MDSATDICGAQREILLIHRASFPQAAPIDLSDDFLRGYIGRHLIDLFAELGFAPEKMDSMVDHYRTVYMARGHAGTTVYPGVADMLARLGGRKSTATTKTSKGTRVILEQFGLLSHFHHVQGTDGFPAKPEPDVVLASLKGLGARPEDALFIGDSPADMEAAKRAGVRSCAVRWGYGDLKEMARWEPDFWIDTPDQLLAQ